MARVMSSVVSHLAREEANAVQLYLQYKGYHWNVAGPLFRELHLLFDEHAKTVFEMIDALADCDRVVKYIDMPLQHINDRLLTMMRRRVTRRQIETLLSKLRTKIPGITLRTTLIAGSPTETDAEHAELLQFIQDFQFDMLGVFPYSAEPGTPMGRMDPQIPEQLKRQRMEELMLTQQQIAFTKARHKIGQTVEALIDRPADSRGQSWIARSTAQAPQIDSVTFIQGEDLHVGMLLPARVVDTSGYDLIAQSKQEETKSLPVLIQSVEAAG